MELCVALLLVAGAGSVRGQDGAVAGRMHLRGGTRGSTDGGSASQPLRRPAAGRYDVVALRVEFQPDTTRFTTGDGTFGGALFDTLRPSIDPLPHDADYFRAHLSFLEHYVETVSDGATTIRTHLVPEVVQLPHRMAHYSPTGPDADAPEERRKMALLVRDAWEGADRRSGFDMSPFDPERTVLVLFHAGAGRDVELVGTSLRKTPEDLPSLFLGADRLDRFLDERPRFDGFPVDHSIVLPETETRMGDDPISGDPYLAEFSLNGLMAASFFSFLGVPDLFDTGSGRTGIGPFGLMDPMGIFAYRGLFPPEPSGWTRWYLGWIDAPVWRPQPGGTVRLRAAGAAEDVGGSGDGGGGSERDRVHAAVRVPIAPGEYFLLENRHRDPGGDGLQLTVWEDGTTRTVSFDRSEEGLSRFSVEAFPGGVVTGVSDYDWAIPGAPAEADSLLLGGTAVWHVDERRIRAGLATNRVNADPDRRGLDLEEADGAQDLGREATGLLGTGVERGTPFDLFYRGNPVRVVTQEGETVRLYENRFGPETRPSSASNRGGPSFVAVEAFSETAPVTEARVVEAEESTVARIPAWTDRELEGRFGSGGQLLAPPPWATDAALFALEDSAAGGRRLLRVGREETETAAEGLLARPAWLETGWAGPVVTEEGGWALRLPDGTRVAPPPGSGGEGPGGRPVGDPVVLREPPGDASGREALYQLVRSGGETRLARFDPTGEAAVAARFEDLEGRVLTRGGTGDLAIVGSETARLWKEGSRWTWNASEEGGPDAAAFGRDEGGRLGVLADTAAGHLRWLLPDGTIRRVETGGRIGEPVLEDLDGDGTLDVLVAGAEDLRAYTQEGAPVEGFPVVLEARTAGVPLLLRPSADAGGEGPVAALVSGRDGYLYGRWIGRRGYAPGYPLAAGRAGIGATVARDSLVATLTPDGVLQAWRFSRGAEVRWGQRSGNALNHRYVAVAGSTPPSPDSSADLVDVGRSYVWPNPVRSGPGHVRLVCRRRCSVDVTVVDVAGMVVDRLAARSQRAGIPRDLAWEAEVGSGVYYVRVQARGPDGATDTVLLRMAVVR